MTEPQTEPFSLDRELLEVLTEVVCRLAADPAMCIDYSDLRVRLTQRLLKVRDEARPADQKEAP